LLDESIPSTAGTKAAADKRFILVAKDSFSFFCSSVGHDLVFSTRAFQRSPGGSIPTWRPPLTLLFCRSCSQIFEICCRTEAFPGSREPGTERARRHGRTGSIFVRFGHECKTVGSPLESRWAAFRSSKRSDRPLAGPPRRTRYTLFFSRARSRILKFAAEPRDSRGRRCKERRGRDEPVPTGRSASKSARGDLL